MPRIIPTIAAVLGVSALTLSAQAAPVAPDEGRYVSAAELTHLLSKPKDGLSLATVPTGPGGLVMAAKRETVGTVEVHTYLSDEFFVQSGHALVRVGGKVTGNHEVSPGEWRGGEIVGGHTYQVAPGDVLWIPAGSPHQVTPKGGPFRYLTAKFEAK